jgi:hypothetical protein
LKSNSSAFGLGWGHELADGCKKTLDVLVVAGHALLQLRQLPGKFGV